MVSQQMSSIKIRSQQNNFSLETPNLITKRLGPQQLSPKRFEKCKISLKFTLLLFQRLKISTKS